MPERLLENLSQIPIKERKVHIGYRARKLPFWYGELAYEKWNIVEKWHKYTNDIDIVSDLSYRENDRIYGASWTDFLNSCKATLGVESGASVMDFTGKIEVDVESFQAENPSASFYDVRERFFKEEDGKYSLNQISPRCFEAAATKTALVLYEGEYSGILQPNEHYIPLKKNYSNVNDVINKLKDDAFLQELVDRTYTDIVKSNNYSYKTFINQVDEIISNEFSERKKQISKCQYTDKEFIEVIQYKTLRAQLAIASRKLYNKLSPRHKQIVKKIYYEIKVTLYPRALNIYSILPEKVRLFLRIILKPVSTFRLIKAGERQLW